MDFKLFVVSFVTVFVSELGDKSQLAAIALGGSSPSPKVVFLGSASALLLASFLSVLLGESTALLLPEKVGYKGCFLFFFFLFYPAIWVWAARCTACMWPVRYTSVMTVSD